MDGLWTTLEIAGKPVDAYDPPEEGKPRFGVLHLHGVGQESLRDNEAHTRALAELGLACLCPQGDISWWADRLCPAFDPEVTAERHLLENVVPLFEQRWGIKPRAIGLHGISMGGQGALRLAFKYPNRFPVVAAVASAIEYQDLFGQGYHVEEMYDSKEQCRQDTAILHVHPSNHPKHIFFCIDPADEMWYRGNDRLHEKLSALGVAHRADLTTEAGGHSWEYFDHMAGPTLRFIHEGLRQESMRLL